MASDFAAGLPEALAEAVQRVRDDREHGASWLARAAATTLAQLARDMRQTPSETLALTQSTAQAFAATRPSMAALTNTVAHIWASATDVGNVSPEQRLHAAQAEAQRLLDTWVDAATAITAHARQILTGTLYSHSRSGTVELVLLALSKDSKENADKRQIILGEARPGGEGIAAAQALAKGGWHVTLVPDMACGLFIGHAKALVMGADSVRSDGSVVNKVGSYPLALVAREAGVPVYILCETLKIAPLDFPLTLEEMNPTELLLNAEPNITPRNVYFDHTPASLITGIVTERGLLTLEQIRAFAEEAGAAQTMLMTNDRSA